MSRNREETPPGPADVAIVANANTPYRLHLHRRIVAELPALRLWSVFTHGRSNAPWDLGTVASINPVEFGAGEASDDQARLRFALREWRKGGRIVTWIRERGIRAVVLLGYNDLARLRILGACRRAGIPVLLWGDSNVAGDRATGLKRLLKRLALPQIIRRCDALLACGSLGVAYFKRYGGDERRIFLHPVEPDYALIRSLPAERVESVRARFGLSPARRRIVYSGRLAAVKRVDLAIDAFRSLAERRPEWDLLIVGDGPERAALERRVPEELRARVTWTGFVGDQADVSALYRLSDVLVLPSDYEPWALVINEAAAAGLAIVASDVVGAAAELVVGGVNGFRFPAGDLASLTGCLEAVTDPARIDAFKAGSGRALADWRRRADPVKGLARALRACGVLRGDVRGAV